MILFQETSKSRLIFANIVLLIMIVAFVFNYTYTKNIESIVGAILFSLLFFCCNASPRDGRLISLDVTDNELNFIYYYKNKKQSLIINKSDIELLNLDIELKFSGNRPSCFTYIGLFTVLLKNNQKYELRYVDDNLNITKQIFKIRNSIPNFSYKIDKIFNSTKFVNTLLSEEKTTGSK